MPSRTKTHVSMRMHVQGEVLAAGEGAGVAEEEAVARAGAVEEAVAVDARAATRAGPCRTSVHELACRIFGLARCKSVTWPGRANAIPCSGTELLAPV